jgi:hypothetical protein
MQRGKKRQAALVREGHSVLRSRGVRTYKQCHGLLSTHGRQHPLLTSHNNLPVSQECNPAVLTSQLWTGGSQVKDRRAQQSKQTGDTPIPTISRARQSEMTPHKRFPYHNSTGALLPHGQTAETWCGGSVRGCGECVCVWGGGGECVCVCVRVCMRVCVCVGFPNT